MTMMHAFLPPADLTVLLDELIDGEEEIEALLVIAQGRAHIIQVALHEEEERQPITAMFVDDVTAAPPLKCGSSEESRGGNSVRASRV